MSDVIWSDENRDVHAYFGLTYANYLVLHRTILQSMPDEWQRRFVEVMDELDDAVWRSGIDVADRYQVTVRDEAGRFRADPVPHYNRGRTHLDAIAAAAQSRPALPTREEG